MTTQTTTTTVTLATQTPNEIMSGETVMHSTPVKKGAPLPPPLSPGYIPEVSMSSESDTTLEFVSDDDTDPTQPPTTTRQKPASCPAEFAKELKYIVFEHKLLELFVTCPLCTHHPSLLWTTCRSTTFLVLCSMNVYTPYFAECPGLSLRASPARWRPPGKSLM